MAWHQIFGRRRRSERPEGDLDDQSPGDQRVECPVSDPIQQRDYPGRIIVDRPTINFEPRVASFAGSQAPSFRPDMVLDGWSTDELCVRAACVRGDAHRIDGTPRQDDFSLAHHAATGSVVFAVADGVSSLVTPTLAPAQCADMP